MEGTSRKSTSKEAKAKVAKKVDAPAVAAAERKRRLEQIRKASKPASAAPKHAAALAEQIEQSEQGAAPRKKMRAADRAPRVADTKDSEPNDTDAVEHVFTEKILQRARAQLSEEQQRAAADAEADRAASVRSVAGPDDGAAAGGLDDGDDEDADDEDAGADSAWTADDDQQSYERAAAELEATITADDEAALAQFMHEPDSATPALTLADIIMQKIHEHEHGLAAGTEQLEHALAQRLDPKVLQVFKGVGKLLSSYTSGPLPKAFKIIPALSNWEEVLWLTDPPSWTPAAAAAATRIFASNLNAKMAQRFYNLVLLPMVRQDIKAHKRLNFHLYLALKKALFKSSAFYRGILLPLAESGQCTLREAAIIASVVGHVSVPVLDSSVAILKLADMPYSGANSVFLRTLLNKKYALPFRVVHAVVKHFVSFRHETRQLPMLWHQALLVFVQRYKNDLLPSERDGLMTLLRHQSHPLYVEDMRRELLHATVREAPAQSSMES